MSFVPIKNYETYSINKNGEIKDLRNGHLLNFHKNHTGYLMVNLKNPDGYKPFLVSRLVLMTFSPNENYNNLECDHKDRNRLNNKLDNLRWVNKCENQQNKSVHKNNKLQVKHITYSNDQRSCRYVFQICINGVRHKKSFSTKKYTLEDAIKYRDEYIKNSNSKFISD